MCSWILINKTGVWSFTSITVLHLVLKSQMCISVCCAAPQTYNLTFWNQKCSLGGQTTSPPTHQAMKRGYSFPHIDAWGPLFMTRDWGRSNITDSEGQRFLGNQHKDCGTRLQEQTLVISWPLCMSSGDPHGIQSSKNTGVTKAKAITIP